MLVGRCRTLVVIAACAGPAAGCASSGGGIGGSRTPQSSHTSSTPGTPPPVLDDDGTRLAAPYSWSDGQYYVSPDGSATPPVSRRTALAKVTALHLLNRGHTPEVFLCDLTSYERSTRRDASGLVPSTKDESVWVVLYHEARVPTDNNPGTTSGSTPAPQGWIHEDEVTFVDATTATVLEADTMPADRKVIVGGPTG